MTAQRFAAATMLFGVVAIAPATSAAQSLSDEWRFRVAPYMWAAKITGSATFPVANTVPFSMSFSEIIDHLKMTGMGTLEAQKGRWGAFTDIVYLNVGGTRTATRDGTIDGVPLPVGVTLNAGLDLKSWIWTLAVNYRLQATPEYEVDFFVGARYLSIEPRLTYDFSADVGPFVGPARTGARTVKGQDWNAIGGFKGRVRFGANREWFIPYYVDVGGGESKFTWQAATGIGYAFSWGDAYATYRYLDFDFDSSSRIRDLTVKGPLVGVALRW
jgi:hypothetical protein